MQLRKLGCIISLACNAYHPLAAVGRGEKLGKRALTKQGEAGCHRQGARTKARSKARQGKARQGKEQGEAVCHRLGHLPCHSLLLHLLRPLPLASRQPGKSLTKNCLPAKQSPLVQSMFSFSSKHISQKHTSLGFSAKF